MSGDQNKTRTLKVDWKKLICKFRGYHQATQVKIGDKYQDKFLCKTCGKSEFKNGETLQIESIRWTVRK
jgi:hypothetical protein